MGIFLTDQIYLNHFLCLLLTSLFFDSFWCIFLGSSFLVVIFFSDFFSDFFVFLEFFLLCFLMFLFRAFLTPPLWAALCYDRFLELLPLDFLESFFFLVSFFYPM